MHYHVAMSCDGVLKEKPDVAGSIFRDTATKKSLSASEAYTLATMWKARGYEVIPPCKNHDAKGYCKGHGASIASSEKSS